MKKKNFLFGCCVLLTTMTFLFANNQSSVEAVTLDSVEALSEGNGSGDPVYLGDPNVYTVGSMVYFKGYKNKWLAKGCKSDSNSICEMNTSEGSNSGWSSFWQTLTTAVVTALTNWLTK